MNLVLDFEALEEASYCGRCGAWREQWGVGDMEYVVVRRWQYGVYVVRLYGSWPCRQFSFESREIAFPLRVHYTASPTTTRCVLRTCLSSGHALGPGWSQLHWLTRQPVALDTEKTLQPLVAPHRAAQAAGSIFPASE